MTVKELKDAVKAAGLQSLSVAFHEKIEFVQLLESFYSGATTAVIASDASAPPPVTPSHSAATPTPSVVDPALGADDAAFERDMEAAIKLSLNQSQQDSATANASGIDHQQKEATSGTRHGPSPCSGMEDGVVPNDVGGEVQEGFAAATAGAIPTAENEILEISPDGSYDLPAPQAYQGFNSCQSNSLQWIGPVIGLDAFVYGPFRKRNGASTSASSSRTS